MLSMQLGGAVSNVVVRAEEPSSAGHGVAPVSVAPRAAAGGVIPDLGNVVEVGTVDVGVEDFDVELMEPRKAPRVESTTTAATPPAAIFVRRRAFCCRAVAAVCAFWRANCR